MTEDMQDQGEKAPIENHGPLTCGERLALFMLRLSFVLQVLSCIGISKLIVVGHFRVEPLGILMFWTSLLGIPVSLFLLRKRYSDPDCELWLLLNIPGFLFCGYGFWVATMGTLE